ncbi:hypothetical protein A2841_03090 [Candidatus Kaiserbacteria bacterium RIFCSPHIGHO2_01_FULL_48_10]|uniref:Metallopeptidase family protein n=1 Tax=Candidatus Kaiserbacteria bacterium RIFCSPHIGHO2_01_FULL_48_10 TaxID=1798476 RepID=A0A1F6C5M5_9BACT|nr:MAG: hypothetical protein A2841_03090 [Candidatus Kaiserbacteria bacterium RIFCSPHIGHO2_01_FULL_48_10]
MPPNEFEALVAEAFALVPENFRTKVKNVALLVEEEPSDEVRKEQNLGPHATLLALYRGIPQTERGEGYGVGPTLPDTITIYRRPILEKAAYESGVGELVAWGEVMTEPLKRRVRAVVRDTLWHEIAHYFGMDEHEVGAREEGSTNEYTKAP